MNQEVIEEKFQFERQTLSFLEEITCILLDFHRTNFIRTNEKEFSFNVKGKIIFDLKDQIEPTYTIKLNITVGD